jgi:hypothetical protein
MSGAMTTTTTTIHDVWIYTKQRRRKPDVFDLVLSSDGIVVQRPGRPRQRMGWDRISEWEIEDRQGYVLLTLRGGGSTTRLVVTGWSASGLGSALEEAKAGSTGAPGLPSTATPPAATPPAATPPAASAKTAKTSAPAKASTARGASKGTKAVRTGGASTAGAKTAKVAKAGGAAATARAGTTARAQSPAKVAGASKVTKSTRGQVGAPAHPRPAATEIPEATAVAVARTAGKLEEFEVIETDEAADVLAVADTIEAPRAGPPAGDSATGAGGETGPGTESDGDLAEVVGLEPMTWTQLPWKPIVTVVLLGALAFAVIVVLLQSAGIIDWGFLGPTA